VALIMAANILWTGCDLVRRSFNGLMDHALPVAEQELLRQTITAHLQPHMTFHALRTRQAGARRFVDFHLLVPGSLTVAQAHAHSDTIEAALRAALPGAEITVHIEPIEDRAAWRDSELLGVEDLSRKPQP
jgi:divalent metal cation (Fe/Co/Zn/Cd) transporter